MKRLWHSVNAYNNIFHWYVPDGTTQSAGNGVTLHNGTYTQITISDCTPSNDPPDGNTELALAIQTALQTVFDTPAVTYSSLKRRFSINTGANYAATFNSGAAVDATGYFVCFHCQNGYQARFPAPVGVSRAGFHNDSHVLLGGAPNSNAHTSPTLHYPQPAFMSATGLPSLGAGVHMSVFPCCKETMESICLRTAVPSSNWQTSGFEAVRTSSDKLQHSNILARIPIDSSDDHITFVNQSENFSMILQTTHVDQIVFQLTDDMGRSLAGLLSGSPGNHLAHEAFGLLSYRIVLRWDAMSMGPERPLPTRPANEALPLPLKL